MISAMRKIEQAYAHTKKWAKEIAEGADLSPSRITLFKICGLKFHYAYTLGMKRPPVARMAFGSAGHAALNTDLETKRHYGECIKDSMLFELFEDTLSVNLRQVERRREDKPMGQIKDEFIGKGRRLLALYR